MDTNQIVQELIAERDRLNAAITALTGGAATKRRGRPPKSENTDNVPDWVKPATKKAAKKKSRGWTPEQKAAAAERMKARWLAKKKPAKKAKKAA